MYNKYYSVVFHVAFHIVHIAHPIYSAHLPVSSQDRLLRWQGRRFHAMSINKVETIVQVVWSRLYGGADGM